MPIGKMIDNPSKRRQLFVANFHSIGIQGFEATRACVEKSPKIMGAASAYCTHIYECINQHEKALYNQYKNTKVTSPMFFLCATKQILGKQTF